MRRKTMEGTNAVGPKPQVISSEELKALLYLTLRGQLKIPEGEVRENSVGEKRSEIDIKA